MTLKKPNKIKDLNIAASLIGTIGVVVVTYITTKKIVSLLCICIYFITMVMSHYLTTKYIFPHNVILNSQEKDRK